MLLKALLLDLEKQINHVKLDGSNGFTRPGRYILTFFEVQIFTAELYHSFVSADHFVIVMTFLNCLASRASR